MKTITFVSIRFTDAPNYCRERYDDYELTASNGAKFIYSPRANRLEWPLRPHRDELSESAAAITGINYNLTLDDDNHEVSAAALDDFLAFIEKAGKNYFARCIAKAREAAWLKSQGIDCAEAATLWPSAVVLGRHGIKAGRLVTL